MAVARRDAAFVAKTAKPSSNSRRERTSSRRVGGAYTCAIEKKLQSFKNMSLYWAPRLSWIRRVCGPSMLSCRFLDAAKFTKHSGGKPEITFQKTMIDLLDYWRQRTAEDVERLVR
jgi:GDPmannose 4,6-dehydratase